MQTRKEDNENKKCGCGLITCETIRQTALNSSIPPIQYGAALVPATPKSLVRADSNNKDAALFALWHFYPTTWRINTTSDGVQLQTSSKFPSSVTEKDWDVFIFLETLKAKSSRTLSTPPFEMPSKNRTFLLPDQRQLSYFTLNNDKEETILLFHGMTESASIFLTNSFGNYRTILIDRPGYGNSSPPPFPYSYELFAYDIQLLLKYEKISTLKAVLGHSSGGPCALSVAYYLGESVVDKCILIASDVEYSHPIAKEENLSDPLLEFKEFLSTSPQEISNKKAIDLGFVTARELKLDLSNYRNSIKRNQTSYGILNDFYLERIPWGFDLSTFPNAMKRIRVVFGEQDPFLSKEHVYFFSKVMKQEIPIKFEPDYGHFDVILDKECFQRIIDDLGSDEVE